jgi:hypothetical protein
LEVMSAMNDELASLGVMVSELRRMTRAEQLRTLEYLRDRFQQHPVRGEARGEDNPQPAKDDGPRGTPEHPCEKCKQTTAGAKRDDRGFLRCNTCGYPGQ